MDRPRRFEKTESTAQQHARLQYGCMIALLRGLLIEKHPNQAIVETGGVGYDVTIPVSTFTRLPDPGAEVMKELR